MNALRSISKILMIFPVGTLLYDAIKSWFVDAHFAIRSLKGWWTWLNAPSFDAARAKLGLVIPGQYLDLVFNAPAPLPLLAPPVILYAVYRFCFFLKGGKTAGGYTYKSRH
jgi:hypothetical protein